MNSFNRIKYVLERSYKIFFLLYAVLISVFLIQRLLDSINVCSNIVYFDMQTTFIFLTLPLFPLWLLCVCLERFNVIKLGRRSFFGYFFAIHLLIFIGTISRLGDGSYYNAFQFADHNALKSYLYTYKSECGHFPEESKILNELKSSSSCQEFLKTIKDENHDQYIEYLFGVHEVVVINGKLKIENKFKREYAWCKDYRYKGLSWKSLWEEYTRSFGRKER